jgi:hypothetical protein
VGSTTANQVPIFFFIFVYFVVVKMGKKRYGWLPKIIPNISQIFGRGSSRAMEGITVSTLATTGTTGTTGCWFVNCLDSVSFSVLQYNSNFDFNAEREDQVVRVYCSLSFLV